jgi:hypothetical protein
MIMAQKKGHQLMHDEPSLMPNFARLFQLHVSDCPWLAARINLAICLHHKANQMFAIFFALNIQFKCAKATRVPCVCIHLFFLFQN